MLLMGSGYVGILTVELHFPEGGSLKGKRKYVKSAKAQLQHRFGASVAEVDHHELWQRSRLTLSCVARGYREVEALLDGAERYLAGQAFELGHADRDDVAVGFVGNDLDGSEARRLEGIDVVDDRHRLAGAVLEEELE